MIEVFTSFVAQEKVQDSLWRHGEADGPAGGGAEEEHGQAEGEGARQGEGADPERHMSEFMRDSFCSFFLDVFPLPTPERNSVSWRSFSFQTNLSSQRLGKLCLLKKHPG